MLTRPRRLSTYTDLRSSQRPRQISELTSGIVSSFVRRRLPLNDQRLQQRGPSSIVFCRRTSAARPVIHRLPPSQTNASAAVAMETSLGATRRAPVSFSIKHILASSSPGRDDDDDDTTTSSAPAPTSDDARVTSYWDSYATAMSQHGHSAGKYIIITMTITVLKQVKFR